MSALLFILLLIVVNGILAMSEAAIISARKAKLRQQVNEGNAGAGVALELAENPSRFLSTVQVGITLIGIFAGAFGEVKLRDDLVGFISRIPGLAAYSESISLGIVVLGITYISLVIGELVPKRLALQNPERIAGLIAGPMRTLAIIFYPVVHLLTVSTEAILHLLGVHPSTDPPVTEEEIKVLLEQGTRAGVFEAAEQNMVVAVFRLTDQRAGDLMTPRPEIIWFDLKESPVEISETITTSGYSRFPVCQDDLDHVVGVVQAKDLLACSLAGQPLDLKACLRPALFVPETSPAGKVLELFKQTQMPMALVIDEYGGMQGLVTLHDILEAIVGDVEPDEPQAVQREDGSWLLDGALPVEEFKELFHLDKLPEDERGYYQTLGGFVIMCLGRIPIVGDHFQWNQLHFEVVDMDGRRIDKILVAPGGEKVSESQTVIETM